MENIKAERDVTKAALIDLGFAELVNISRNMNNEGEYHYSHILMAEPLPLTTATDLF